MFAKILKMNYKNGLLIVGVVSILLSFVFQYNKDKKGYFLIALQAFVDESTQLNEIADQHKLNKKSLQELQQQLLSTRIKYKKVEFLIEFYYPSFRGTP
jgi:hypothetical protein